MKDQETDISSRRLILLMGWIGIIGSFGGVCADIATAYSSTSGHKMMTVVSGQLGSVEALLLEKSHTALVMGHYLAIIFIPLAMAGVWHITRMINPNAPVLRGAVFFLGMLVYAIGTAFHGTFGFVASVLQFGDPVLIAQIADFYEPLAIITMAAMGTILFVFAVIIALGRTAYPRWLALLSPLSLQAAFSVFGMILPPIIGNAFLVTGLNLSMLIFLLISLSGILGGWWVLPNAIRSKE